MKYPIYIEQNKIDLSYKVKVNDLPGCEVKTDSVDQAFTEITKTIKAHLAILAEYSEPIPKATLIEKHLDKRANVIWGVIDIDITPYLGKSHKINVTLPELLINQIDVRVSKSEEYKTRSGFIASACLVELAK